MNSKSPIYSSIHQGMCLWLNYTQTHKGEILYTSMDFSEHKAILPEHQRPASSL